MASRLPAYLRRLLWVIPGDGLQYGYYADLHSDHIYSRSTQSYIHASDTPYNDAWVSWYTANSFANRSLHCR